MLFCHGWVGLGSAGVAWRAAGVVVCVCGRGRELSVTRGAMWRATPRAKRELPPYHGGHHVIRCWPSDAAHPTARYGCSSMPSTALPCAHARLRAARPRAAHTNCESVRRGVANPTHPSSRRCECMCRAAPCAQRVLDTRAWQAQPHHGGQHNSSWLRGTGMRATVHSVSPARHTHTTPRPLSHLCVSTRTH